MKYIRIKVKYLLLIGVILIAIINYRDLQLFGYRALAVVNDDLSSELIENMKVTDVKSANAQLESVISGINTTIYNPVIIGSGYMTTGGKISYEDAQQVYEKYLDFTTTEKKNDAFYEYAMNVSLALWFGELPDEAIEVLKEVDTTKLTPIQLDEYRLMKATYLFSLLQLDEAMDEIQKMQNHYPLIKEQVTAFIYALQHNASIPSKDKPGHYSEEERKIYPLYENICDNYYLDSSKETISSQKIIQGRVTYNGQAMQGVIVYLKDNNNIFSSSHISSYFAVTDADGYYTLEAYEGDSFLDLAIPWQIAYDKQIQYEESGSGIEFENNVATMNYAFYDLAYVESAEVIDDRLHYEIIDPMYEKGRQYQISLSYKKPEYNKSGNNAFDLDEGDMEMFADGRIKGSIDLETLRHKMRIPYSYMGGLNDFQLVNFLEPLYLSEDYYLEVSIKDDEDKIVRNGFNNGAIRYSQFIEGEDLSKGDKRIEAGDMEGALHWFEENQSVHGLKVLTSLYEKGYYDDKDEEDEKDYSYYHEGIDLDKAIFYAKKLLDIEPMERFYQSRLQYLYEDAGRYEESLAMLEQMMESDTDEENKYNHFQKGRLLIQQGNYEEGIEEYLNLAESPEDDDRFYAYLILGNRIEDMRPFYREQFKDIDRSAFYAFFALMNAGRYDDAYSKLGQAVDSDLKTFYTLLFEKEFSDYRQIEEAAFVDYYVQVTESIESDTLQKILKELVKYNGWFY